MVDMLIVVFRGGMHVYAEVTIVVKFKPEAQKAEMQLVAVLAVQV